MLEGKNKGFTGSNTFKVRITAPITSSENATAKNFILED